MSKKKTLFFSKGSTPIVSYDGQSIATPSGQWLGGWLNPNNGTDLVYSKHNADRYAYYTLNDSNDITAGLTFQSQTSSGSMTALVLTGYVKADGTTLWATTQSGIREFSLSTPFNFSTASLVRTWTPSGADMTSVFFKPDGSGFICSRGQGIYEYSCATDWVIDNNVTLENTINIGNFQRNALFSSDGTKLFSMVDKNALQYDLDTPYDLSNRTLKYEMDLSSVITSGTGFDSMCVVGKVMLVGTYTSPSTIYQFNLSSSETFGEFIDNS
jgi:hypothetical protein